MLVSTTRRVHDLTPLSDLSSREVLPAADGTYTILARCDKPKELLSALRKARVPAVALSGEYRGIVVIQRSKPFSEWEKGQVWSVLDRFGV